MAEEFAQSMPRSKSAKMKRIEFVVPEPLLEQTLAIAASDGISEAEMHRLFWILGKSVYSEMSNKNLVNQKLRRHLEDSGMSPDADLRG